MSTSQRKPLIYVESTNSDVMVKRLFDEIGELTLDYDVADIIVFTGGSDISPSLYGEVTLEKTQVNITRDAYEVSLYHRMLRQTKRRIAFVGICRGGQLLNVMNGGKLWQDVEGHKSTHSVIDLTTNKVVRVNSYHHQMMRPPKASQNIPHAVLAEACDDKGVKFDKTQKFGPEKSNDLTHDGRDVEAVWYPTTRSLCFQPHPEYQGFVQCVELFKQYMDMHVIPSLLLGPPKELVN